ncbi:condensation domain-containing protein [Serinicoccus kebangsaanensis]|uniref:condensation domain-containing protein n=1 Tax=Serinicoccus kebangsaanensis TaxID=2602069 RepID=UPI00178C2E49|nr:condensation domain-containing protein [Serinicoccus kebangsaanensis]
MRLTNVGMMVLPQGQVSSYTVRVASRTQELPVSFDQRRHVGAGPRAGSWMAISFRLPAGTSPADVEAAWLSVVDRHGTLRTVFTGGGQVRLHGAEVRPGAWRDLEVTGRRSRDVVRECFDELCQPFAQPSHALCLVRPDAPDELGDDRPVLLVGADHAHVDMWSVAVLARDLLAALGGDPAPGTALPFATHTAELEAAPPAPAQVHTRWSQILADGGGWMPTFPMPLGPLDPAPAEVVEVRDVLDEAGWQAVEEVAARHGARPITLAVALLTEVCLELAGAPLRAVFPVHSRHESRWHDSVGWFITNAVLECRAAELETARAAVVEAVDLGSYPLAPILEPHGGMPEGPGMFALSWLDTRRLPVRLDPGVRAQYVSAAIRTDSVMVWFVVTEQGLQLRARYPDTAEARASLTSWLDAVHRRFRQAAAGPRPT